eukprot:scaffold58400_cov20-Tisochrysis_lutea.AAC.1
MECNALGASDVLKIPAIKCICVVRSSYCGPPQHNRMHRSDGIWHPDSLPPSMAWSGSASSGDAAQQLPGSHINPFLPMPELAMVGTFTEVLPPGAQHLQ